MENEKIKQLESEIESLKKEKFEAIERAKKAQAEIIDAYEQKLKVMKQPDRNASDEERLRYARENYPKGTEFKSASSGKEFISSGKMSIIYGCVHDSSGINPCVYNNLSDQWATIVSKPEVKEEPIGVVRNGQDLYEPTTEPKAGDRAIIDIPVVRFEENVVGEKYIKLALKDIDPRAIEFLKCVGHLEVFVELEKSQQEKDREKVMEMKNKYISGLEPVEDYLYQAIAYARSTKQD